MRLTRQYGYWQMHQTRRVALTWSAEQAAQATGELQGTSETQPLLNRRALVNKKPLLNEMLPPFLVVTI
jgi:hypothetical protein